MSACFVGGGRSIIRVSLGVVAIGTKYRKIGYHSNYKNILRTFVLRRIELGMVQSPSIDQLRDRVSRITGVPRRAPTQAVSLGIPEIDGRLPARGLARGGIHEVNGDLGSATSLLAAFLSRQKAIRQVIWVTGSSGPSPLGLSQLGLDHRRLAVVQSRHHDDQLWAAEEALRELGYGAVVAEIDKVDLTESRRLQLAAEGSGAIGFLLRRDRSPIASLTRWHIEPARSPDCLPRWQLSLTRARWAEAGGTWTLGWDYAAFHFNLVASMAGRSAEAAE
jgi:protein ImuA